MESATILTPNLCLQTCITNVGQPRSTHFNSICKLPYLYHSLHACIIASDKKVNYKITNLANVQLETNMI